MDYYVKMATILGAIGTLVTTLIALVGIVTWRKQLKRASRYKLSKNILTQFYYIENQILIYISYFYEIITLINKKENGYDYLESFEDSDIETKNKLNDWKKRSIKKIENEYNFIINNIATNINQYIQNYHNNFTGFIYEAKIEWELDNCHKYINDINKVTEKIIYYQSGLYRKINGIVNYKPNSLKYFEFNAEIKKDLNELEDTLKNWLAPFLKKISKWQKIKNEIDDYYENDNKERARIIKKADEERLKRKANNPAR